MEEELNKILDGLNKKDKSELVTENITIKDNLLKFHNDTVQISNISQIFAGQNKLKFANSTILVGLISLIVFFTFDVTFIKMIGFIGIIVTIFTMYNAYKNYIAARYLLRFHMNAGTSYTVPFKDENFLLEVKEIVESSFLKDDLNYVIDVGDKVIMQGNNHIIKGDNNNLNTGIQKDVQVHSNNDSNNSSFSMSIKDSDIKESNFGEKNSVNTIRQQSLDWGMLEVEFQKVLEQIKIDTPLKKISEEALVIIGQKDESKFKAFVKKHATIFTSDFFKNTASGLLVQWISNLYGNS